VAWYAATRKHPLLAAAPAGDHKPVGAALQLDVAVHDAERKLQVQADICRSLDAWENECMPMAQLECNELSFGAVTFGRPATRRTTLTNTGQTTLQFSFVDSSRSSSVGESSSSPKKWLHVAPWSGLLLPGESCALTATVEVDSADAAALNAGGATLEAILLLVRPRCSP